MVVLQLRLEAEAEYGNFLGLGNLVLRAWRHLCTQGFFGYTYFSEVYAKTYFTRMCVQNVQFALLQV